MLAAAAAFGLLSSQTHDREAAAPRRTEVPVAAGQVKAPMAASVLVSAEPGQLPTDERVDPSWGKPGTCEGKQSAIVLVVNC